MNTTTPMPTFAQREAFDRLSQTWRLDRLTDTGEVILADIGTVLCVLSPNGVATEWNRDGIGEDYAQTIRDDILASGVQVVTVPEFAVEQHEDFNYQYGSLHGRGGITTTSAPRPERFAWGRVLRVHVIGDDYAIVEHTRFQASNVSDEDYDPSPKFAVYVRGAGTNGKTWDTGHSYPSLDKALIACIAWKAEQTNGGWSAAANSQAVAYVTRMLGIGDNA